MKTLLDATKIAENRWLLFYAKDYPVKEEDEFTYYPIRLIDPAKGTLGYDKDGELTELKTEKKEMMFTQREEERFVDQLKWTKIVFGNGEAMILPPDPEKEDV